MKTPKPAKPGFLARLGLGKKAWESANLPAATEIAQRDVGLWGINATTVASLLSSGLKQARTRQEIYDKWAQMEGDPIVSSAISLLCMAALGGDSASGQMV